MHLEMKNIYKSFDAVKALQDVSLTVGEAEIHGLLGENGAGKSTLMNILGGILQTGFGTNPDRWRGSFSSDSCEGHLHTLGIRFIHQELNLVNDLRVYENLFLHNELVTAGLFLKKKEMIAALARSSQKTGARY